MASIAPPSHTRGTHTTDDWITPKWLIERLGPFELDPCASKWQPWPCAKRSWFALGDTADWPHGVFIWLNPPYKRPLVERFLAKMAAHNNGIALVFARTETKMFFDHVWPKASALLFLRGRLSFCRPDGVKGKTSDGKNTNSGGPSVLIGYGQEATRRLSSAKDLGAFVRLR